MKAELGEMLSQPLIARGISTKFITSGSRRIVDDLLAGDCKSFFQLGCVSRSRFTLFFFFFLSANESMLGLKNVDAGTELMQGKTRKKHRKSKVGATKAGEAN